MNLFAAVTILCRLSLADFLVMHPEERVREFSALIGEERMVSNQDRFHF